ncbi:MAG TPA: beta-propeller fold lactonase family protein [Candidatus Baltobacteraceae bacterium]|nr:beta-propeller fold lactonase family protein [Candidatus Baltobacteraceae bacterium]
MIRRLLPLAAFLSVSGGAALCALNPQTILPSGWRLTPPQGTHAATGTMPQGIALSPDGSKVAVVESGVGPAALHLFDASTLATSATIPLGDAMGRPVWVSGTRVLVAGDSAHAIFDVDLASGSARAIATRASSLPVWIALSPDGRRVAFCDDGGFVGTGTLPDLHDLTRVAVGAHPSGAVFSRDGKLVYVAVRQPSSVAVVDWDKSALTARIPTGLHPAAIAYDSSGKHLLVAESDDDAVGIIDPAAGKRIADISVELHAGSASGYGASPNALAVTGAGTFVSLGAQNAVALLRGGKLVERIPAGWYPTGVAAASGGALWIVNGRGEGSPANPQFRPGSDRGYVGAITVGSLRRLEPKAYADARAASQAVAANAAPQWSRPSSTVVRAGGPIRHAIYIIKENRSYDQVLGDIGGANGDAQLTEFGDRVTPNQHAIARRFGIFDNAYTDAQVSANGHNWTDAAFANDYVERFWPPNYGGRRDLYDFQEGDAPDVPHGGYLWDAAKRAGITYRDYGEDLEAPPHAVVRVPLNTMPGLTGHYDARFVGWDLGYSDKDRLAEWEREFTAFVAHRDLPQLEIVYFPNDHTSGTRPGMPTPSAYIAMNDWAVGKLVDDVSHSPYWRSTAIFVLEDDAQNGPDHVSAQRSTFYVAGAYARGGVQHAHYSTASFVRTIEVLLGLAPLSIYDAAARPLYDAFASTPVNAAPFTAIPPRVSVTAVNARTAYGAARSARMDFTRPDAAPASELNDILAHAARQ